MIQGILKINTDGVPIIEQEDLTHIGTILDFSTGNISFNNSDDGYYEDIKIEDKISFSCKLDDKDENTFKFFEFIKNYFHQQRTYILIEKAKKLSRREKIKLFKRWHKWRIKNNIIPKPNIIFSGLLYNNYILSTIGNMIEPKYNPFLHTKLFLDDTLSMLIHMLEDLDRAMD